MLLELRGHFEGRTVNLFNTQFTQGRAEVPDQQKSRIAVLQRSYGAHGISDSEAGEGTGQRPDDTVPGEFPPPEQGSANLPADNGERAAKAQRRRSRVASNGNGQQHSGVTEDEVRFAIRQLDPSDDSHWTEEGEPALGQMKKLLNEPKITRDKVQTLCPHENRVTVGQIKD
jgi:hypothetical protein